MKQHPTTEPHIVAYDCSSCGETWNSPFGLPVGWSTNASAIWCGSCTALGIPARDMRGRRSRKNAA